MRLTNINAVQVLKDRNTSINHESVKVSPERNNSDQIIKHSYPANYYLLSFGTKKKEQDPFKELFLSLENKNICEAKGAKNEIIEKAKSPGNQQYILKKLAELLDKKNKNAKVDVYSKKYAVEILSTMGGTALKNIKRKQDCSINQKLYKDVVSLLDKAANNNKSLPIRVEACDALVKLNKPELTFNSLLDAFEEMDHNKLSQKQITGILNRSAIKFYDMNVGNSNHNLHRAAGILCLNVIDRLKDVENLRNNFDKVKYNFKLVDYLINSEPKPHSAKRSLHGESWDD